MSATGRRLALLIAVDRYDDPKLGNLESPLKDMEKLKQVLEDDRCGNFAVQTLPNPSFQEARRQIESFLTDARQGDTLLFFFSGHGVVDQNGEFYFALKETNARRPRADSIEAAYLKSLVPHSWATRIVKILDCCFAEAYANEGAKGAGSLTQAHFDPGGEGVYALFGASEKERAWEKDGESLFAKYIIEALSFSGPASGEETITPQSLLAYASQRIHQENDDIVVSPRRSVEKASGDDLILARNGGGPFLASGATVPGPPDESTQASAADALPAASSPVPKSFPRRYGLALLGLVGALVAAVWLVMNGPEDSSDPIAAFTVPAQSDTYAESVLEYKQAYHSVVGARGLTWSVKAHVPCDTSVDCQSGEVPVQVGSDAVSDARSGDTPVSKKLPLLCSDRIAKRDGKHPARYEFILSNPVALDSLQGKAEADYVCLGIDQRFLWHTRPLLSDNITTGVVAGRGYRPELLTDLTLSYRSSVDEEARFWVHDTESNAWPKE